MTSQKIWPVRTAVLILLVAATSAAAASQASHGTPAKPVMTLRGSRWVLSQAALKVDEPPYGRHTTLEFAAGHVRVRGGCTSGTARYRIEAGVLILGNLRLTSVACADAQQRFDSALAAVLTARPIPQLSSTGDLILDTGSKLRFRAEPGPSATAASEFIEIAAGRQPCMGNVPAMCLLTRTKASEPWGLFYEGILDFTPQPGVEYRLRTLVDPVSNPPADAPSRQIFLDAILSQSVVALP